MVDKTVIVENINKLVSESNLSRGAFADMVGISRSNFSKILNGNYPCGEGVINKIVLATGVRKEWIKTGEGKMYKEKQNNSIKSPSILNKENSINERFAEILKQKNISIEEAASILGKTDIYIRKLIRPGESFGLEPVLAILNSFRDINSDWLLTGQGEIFKTPPIGSVLENNMKLPEVPEINKNDTSVVPALLTLIKEQGQTLKEIALGKDKRNLEEEMILSNEIKALQEMLKDQKQQFDNLIKKLDDIILQNNNMSQQKKVV